jgi:hypothetical protein
MSAISRFLTFGVLAFAVVALATPADAADAKDSYYRPCEEADLPGLWKVVHSTPYVDRQQLHDYADPYQWYAFSNDGTQRWLTSDEPKNDLVEIREELDKQPGMTHFTCKDGKFAITRDNDKEGKESWLAFFVTQDRADPNSNVELRPGDVVMTLVGPDGKTQYARQLRKVVEKEKKTAAKETTDRAETKQPKATKESKDK